MRIFLLGATGHTGSHVVDLALARGHTLTAFVRSPQKLRREDHHLTRLQGDPLDVPAMAAAMKGLSFAFFRWLLRHHARDLARMEAFIRATGSEWTIARPPRLVESTQELYRAEVDALPSGASTVSFRAVAKLFVDAIEQRSYLGQVVGLSTPR